MAADNDNGMKKNFLFLQGPQGPFFAKCAKAVQADGHQVFKICLNGGDQTDWGKMPFDAYTGSYADWEQYLAAYITENEITDIAFYSYWRPYHQAAIKLARSKGVQLHGFEEGLLRPYWITLDPRLPCEYAAYVKETVQQQVPMATDVPDDVAEPKQSHVVQKNGSWWMLFWCFRYYLGFFRRERFYKNYETHRPWTPHAEAKLWLKQVLKYPWRKFVSGLRLRQVLKQPNPIYALCLQLDGDSQIKQYCDYDGMRDVLGEVLPAFAAHAPKDSLLVVKTHPLDNGAGRLEDACRKLALRHGLKNRVVFISFGKLVGLLRATRAVITVNSTVGLQALSHQCPVKTLGHAVYNLDGLVDTQDWPDFFATPRPPEMRTYNVLQNVLLKSGQHDGSFYAPPAMAPTLKSCLPDMYRMPAPVNVEQSMKLSRVKAAAV